MSHPLTVVFSDQIRQLAVLSPVLPIPRNSSSKFAEYMLQKQMVRLAFFNVPDYSSSRIRITMHPELVAAEVTASRCGEVRGTGLQFSGRLMDRLGAFHEDYISKPHCCAVGLLMFKGTYHVHCSVYARKGLKVGHLLDFIARECEFTKPKPCLRIIVRGGCWIALA